VQRNAEYVKLKQKFVDQWASVYNEYYIRSGVVLGDSQIQPTFMVNGVDRVTTVSSGTPISGADMSTVTPTVLDGALICQGAIGQHMSGLLGTTNGIILHTLFDRIGLRMPPGRAEGSEDRYLYLDSNGNPQELQVCFQWNRPGTSSNSGNVMVISGLTPDLARELDHMIDGKADAREGMFRQEGITDGTTTGSGGSAGVPGAPGVEWGVNNTEAYATLAAADANGFTSGANKDEDQVQTVVAHYKMNQ